MNVKSLLLLASLMAQPAGAQGFAGLGTDAEGFALPDPSTSPTFPEDHGPHPKYRIEWWYLTATLQDDSGTPYGIQWTLFRSALSPGEAENWTSPQIWMGHAALTSSETHHYAERLSRGGIGQAGARSDPFEAWIDEWSMRSVNGTTSDALDALKLTAGGSDFAYDLTLEADGPIVLHGNAGYSVKSQEGQASYYYSQPHYRVSGRIETETGSAEVSGEAWLDREWSSQPLSEDQTGWDWFSLSFDTGDKLMAFRLRDGGAGYTSGTWIDADGNASPFTDGDLHLTPIDLASVEGRDIPVRWLLEHPSRGVSVEVDALNRNSWMGTSVPYWEGPVSVSGSHEGRGYLEMTGYD